MPDPIQLPDPSQYLIKPKRGVDRLTGFAGERGLTVTSTTGGRHNPGSKHYQGEAVDVRTKDQSPDYINEVMRQAQALGYRVRDERTRPAGQREWGGPHLHMENTPQTAALDRLPDPSKYLKTPPAAPMSEEQRVAEQNAALKAKAPKPAPEGSGAFLRGFDKLRGNAFEKLASDSLANVEAENTRGQLATQQAIQRQRGTVDITKPQRSATMDRRLQENKPVVPRLTAQAIQNNVRQPDVFGIEGRSEGPRTKPPVDRLARQRQQMEARDRQPYMEAAQNGILAPYLQEFESYGWNTKPIVDNVAGALQSADRIINQPIDVQETARRAGAALQKLPGDIIQGAANLSDALGDSGLRVIDNAPRLSEPVRTRVQQANRQIEAEMGVNPDAPSSLATVATEGAISSLPYLATGAVGAGMRGVAAMGALQNTGQTYEDVRARGGAPDIALQTAVRSAPIGALEGLMGTEAALAKAGVSPGLVRQFGAALRAAPPDLAQEVTSQVLNNLNQDRPVLEGTVEAAIGSLATSGALGGASVLGRSAQAVRDRMPQRPVNVQAETGTPQAAPIDSLNQAQAENRQAQQQLRDWRSLSGLSEAAQQGTELGGQNQRLIDLAGQMGRRLGIDPAMLVDVAGASAPVAEAPVTPQAPQTVNARPAPQATSTADADIASFLDAIAAENGIQLPNARTTNAPATPTPIAPSPTPTAPPVRPAEPVPVPARGADIQAQTPQTVSTNSPQNVVKSEAGATVNDRTADQEGAEMVAGRTAQPAPAQRGANASPAIRPQAQTAESPEPIQPVSREATTGEIVDERAGNQNPVSGSGSSVVSATQAPAPASAEPATARTTEGVNVRPDAQEPVSRESDIYRTKEGRVSEAQLAAIDARAEKRASTETGEHGKISAWARKSFETPQGRTTALALQPELRRYLGLPAIPQNADSATLNKAAQHTMDALAEKMGKGRSSEIDHDAHVDFLAQNGPRLSPAVVESYAKTLAAYKAQQAFEDGTAELPEVQQAIKEVNDAKAQNTRQSKQTIRAKFEAIAQAYGLPKVAGTRFADKYFGLKAAQRSVSVDAGRDVQGSSEPQDARVNSEVAPQPATNESGTADRASDAQRREPQPEPPTVEQAGEQVDLPSASPFTEPPSIESLSHMLPRRSLRSLSVDERAQLAAAQSNPDIPVPAFPVKGKPSSMALVEGNEVFGGQSIVRYGAQGEPIGILHFDVDAQGRPDVAVVAVDPKYRRQGIASSLYDFAYNNGIDLSTAEGKGGYTEEGKALKRGREAKADRASDAQRREPQPEPPTVEQAGEQVNEAINRSASAISGQPATVGDFLYNGSTAEGGILKPRGAARNYNELGSWFTSSKEAADELYSKQGTKDLTIRSYAKPQGNLLEAPHQDFARLFGSNIPLVEQHLGKRAAAILRERLPDSVRRTELHRELNENGDFFKVGRSLKQAEMLGKELRQLDAADRVALSAMNNPAYVQAWQKMMQDAGYDGVVWRKSQIDAPRSVKEHDVYLIFHNQELKPISDAAPTQPAPEQPATPDTVPPDKLEIGQPVRIPQGEGTYGGTNPRDPGSHYVDMPDGERIAVKREQISSIGPTKSLGSGLNPFEEARQIAGGVKKIAKAITSPREKSKTLVAFPTDFTMTKWTEEMKTASGKRKHDDKSRTHIKDLIREAYTAYKDDDFGRFLAVEKDLQDVLRSRSMNVVSAANTLTRAASLSGEVSYIGRQGGIPAVTDTRAWARSVKSLFTKGTGFTKESYFNNVARLLSDPAYGAAKEAGVDFALEHEFAANARVLRREENALSGLGERLGRTIGLTQLEQVNKAFIDNLRLQMFKDRAAAMNATGKWADLSPRQQQRMKEMAKEINRFSGRANINEKAQEAVDAAGFLATSARFTISRFQSVDPTKIARAYIAGKRNGDYAAANRMLRDYAKIAAFPLMIGMGLSAMGWEIGSDPDDENFLKAKKGNRHVDILPGGVTSAVKITARLAKRAIEMGKAGKDEEARMAALEKAGDQSVKFLRYKLAPLPSLVVDQVIDRTEMTDKATGRAVSYGKNAIGEPKTFNQSLWDRLHPIAWDNIGENLQKEGAVSLLATWWELIGHNASIYEARGQRMEGAETQKGFIQRETRLENGKLSQEPIADYQQRVEVGTRLLSRYRAMLDASDLYKNASPEQQARMRERLEDRVRRATKQETPNEANLTPADIAKDLRSGDKRNATQDRRLKPFYR